LIFGTPVKTNQGLIRVEHVREGHQIWHREGWKTVAQKVELGPCLPLKLQTDLGYSILVSPERDLDVLLSTGAIGTRKAYNMQGDYLLLDYGIRPFPEIVLGLPPSDIQVPEYMSVPLAYLIGTFAGSDLHQFKWRELQEKVRKQIAMCFEACFGDIQNQKNMRGTFDFSQNALLWYWFQKIDIGCEHSSQLILRSPKIHAISFLRGAWDMKGQVDAQISLDVGSFRTTLLLEIQALMLDVGIECRIEGKPRKLVVSAADRKKFAATIGFTDPAVQKRAEASSVTERKWPLWSFYATLCQRYRNLISCSSLEKKILSGASVRVPASALSALCHLLPPEAPEAVYLNALLHGALPVQVVDVKQVNTALLAFKLEYTS